MIEKNIKPLLRGAPVEKDGVYYFSDPPKDSDQKVRSSEYKNWSRWRQANYHFFGSTLSDMPQSSVLLDIGAGSIHFKDLLFKFSYIGLDFFPFPNVSIVADVTKGLPMRDESVDIVLLSNTLEHMQEPRELLAECHRILKPGGMIIGSIPFLMRIHQAPYDFNRFTHFQLHRLLAGFENVHVAPLGAPFNAYRTLTRNFFETIEKDTHGVRSVLYRLIGSLVRGILKLSPLTTEPNELFTEGYGFSGRKRGNLI